MASSLISNIVITKQDVDYYLQRPSDNKLYKEYFTIPQRVTELFDIEMTVLNLNSAAGAPRTHLTDVSGGHIFSSKQKHSSLITHEFVLNNRTFLPNNKDGKISKVLVTFGPNTITKSNFVNNHLLKMHFVLLDNQTHIYNVPLNDIIKTTHDGVQTVHIVRSTVELPEVMDPGQGGGLFNPDIEEWDDITIPMPV